MQFETRSLYMASSSSDLERRSNEVKYKGVRLRKWGKYVSEIRLPNCRDRIWLGSYDTAQKAARAFDAALFCLRGPTAKFNFPDDPPNFAGAHDLTPPEIQAVAQHYANSTAEPLPPNRPEDELMDQDNSASIDWSFLDTLDTNNAAGGHVMDFGLFHEPNFDMYIPPPHHISDNANQDDHDQRGDGHENGDGNVQSFIHLWNF